MQIPHRSKRASGILGHLFTQGIDDDEDDDDQEEDDDDEDTTIDDVPSDR